MNANIGIKKLGFIVIALMVTSIFAMPLAAFAKTDINGGLNVLIGRESPVELHASTTIKMKESDKDDADDSDRARATTSEVAKNNNGKKIGFWGNIFGKLFVHGKTATTTPDTIAPHIIFATVFGTTRNSARIIWVTNELADSRIWLSATSSVGTTGIPIVNSAKMSYFHDITVDHLATSTTYYYVIGTADGHGNRATSTIGSFTTTQ